MSSDAFSVPHTARLLCRGHCLGFICCSKEWSPIHPQSASSRSHSQTPWASSVLHTLSPVRPQIWLQGPTILLPVDKAHSELCVKDLELYSLAPHGALWLPKRSYSLFVYLVTQGFIEYRLYVLSGFLIFLGLLSQHHRLNNLNSNHLLSHAPGSRG